MITWKIITCVMEYSQNFDSYEYNIPVERAERFEEGDARFLSRWKLKVDNNDTYYKALESGFFNHGGFDNL